MKKCLYCGQEIHKDSVIDFCDSCGTNVFGVKMLRAIKENMVAAEKRGDLEQGNTYNKKQENIIESFREKL